jgi:hypothetical protein
VLHASDQTNCRSINTSSAFVSATWRCGWYYGTARKAPLLITSAASSGRSLSAGMRAYSAFASSVLPAAARVAACTAREEVVRTEPGTWISLIYYREGLLGAVLS